MRSTIAVELKAISDPSATASCQEVNPTHMNATQPMVAST
jgi:hypothetical protein